MTVCVSGSPAGGVLGVGGNGVVVAARDGTAVKRFCSPGVRRKELFLLEKLQGCEAVPELVAPHPDNAIRMKRYQPVQEVAVQRATVDVLAALKELWKIGFCHNDIKPDNVMYRADTGGYVLIDFSNASRVGQKVRFGNSRFVHPRLRGAVHRACQAHDMSSFSRMLRYWASGANSAA